MDKKSKEALRRYKKARAVAAASSSDSSTSSDSETGSSSDSYSSSSSEKKIVHRRKKTRASSSSDDERRQREKAHACHQKKLEAKRNHLKKKLREAKAAKKRALSASIMRRRVDSDSPSKMKMSSEKKHSRISSKDKLRHAAVKEKMRLREKERMRSRSPRTLAKLEAKLRARKSPTSQVSRHQLSPREKIIIQTRNRERTPERKRELKVRHEESRERERRDRERAEREAERQKERDEALARCQERQRKREREKLEQLRREKKEYVVDHGERLLQRPVDREMAIAMSRGYEGRERSLEEEARLRHSHANRLRDPAYEREREYLAATHHRSLLEREDRREREYLVVRRREVLSPAHYHDERDLYSEEERAAYARAYAEEERRRERNWDPRELELLKEREIEKLYSHPRRGDEWPQPEERWDEKAWGRAKPNGPPSEPDWDADEIPSGSRAAWDESRDKRERMLDHVQSPGSGRSGRWPPDWRSAHAVAADGAHGPPHRKAGSFRHVGAHSQMDYLHERQKYRPQPPPLMAIHSGYHPPSRQFPTKRQMTYTNPNLKKKPAVTNTTVTSTTAIPSLLALPPIPPPNINELTGTAEKEPVAPVSEPAKPEASEEGKNLSAPEEVTDDATTKVVEVQPVAVAAAENPTVAEDKPVEATEDTVNSQVAIESAPVEPIPPQESKEEEQPQDTVPVADVTEVQPPADPTPEEQPAEQEPVPDDLSEISDSDDEILDKCEVPPTAVERQDTDGNAETSDPHLATESPAKETTADDAKVEPLEDDLLDFEEISDGELEEDTRTKGVGDALGVDWASLVKEVKVLPTPPIEQTTAKQKWQAHRIVLDVGISLKLAGEEFGKRLLQDAYSKLEEESEHKRPKLEKQEENPVASSSLNNEEEDKKNIKLEPIPVSEPSPTHAPDLNNLHPIACVQIGEKLQTERRSLIAAACGPNSRALSARNDLKLRRQLCGLPVQECDFRRPVSEKTKAIALALFQKTLEVK